MPSEDFYYCISREKGVSHTMQGPMGEHHCWSGVRRDCGKACASAFITIEVGSG